MQLVTMDTPDHAILRKPAETVKFPLDEKTKNFINDFYAFLFDLKSPFSKPAGMAAPQVGVPKRIMIIQIPPEAKQIRKDVFDELPPTVLINPSYTPISQTKNKDWEACYSVPDCMGEVYRYDEIQYEAYTPDGEKISARAKGFLARLIQHETGHLNGELFIDLIEDGCRIGPLSEMLEIRRREREMAL